MPAIRKLAKETALVVMAYNNGATLRVIGGAYRVSPGTVRNILLREGITLRRRGRKNRVLPVEHYVKMIKD